MGKEFVALLGGSIETDGVIYLVVSGVRNLLVAAIYTTATGVNKMFDGMMPACLQYIVEAYDVTFDVCIGVGDAITNASLGGKVNNYCRVILCKKIVYAYLVGYGLFDEYPVAAECFNL